MINVKSALDAWWSLASIFSGGMLGLFLLAAFTRVKGNFPVIMSTVVGVLVILYLTVGTNLLGPNIPGANLHSYLAIVTGTSAIFITGFLIFYITNSLKKKS